jgi:hypothetical protein
VKHSLATSQRATKRSEDGWTGPLWSEGWWDAFSRWGIHQNIW